MGFQYTPDNWKFTVNNPQSRFVFKEVDWKTLKNLVRKLYNMRSNVSLSFLSSYDNGSSLSCFHQKFFKRYSRIFFEASINITVTYHKKQLFVEILLLWYLLKNNQISQKYRVLSLLSVHIDKKFFSAYYKVLKCHCHYFWYALSITAVAECWPSRIQNFVDLYIFCSSCLDRFIFWIIFCYSNRILFQCI